MKNYKRVILIIQLFLCLTFKAYSQDISLNLRNITVKEAIVALEEKYGYRFLYETGDIDTRKKISVNISNGSINDIMKQILAGQDLTYDIKEKNILLTKKLTSPNSPPATKRINGIVVDQQGNPIIGATIKLDGTSQGTISDIDGRFDITVPSNGKLSISYIGYISKTIDIATERNFNITLVEDTKTLDELVVIGYGTQRRSLVTSAISTFKPSENTRTVINPGDMLDGTVSGVTIAKTSGNIGAGLSFSVRGAASLNAGNSPLVVVDGIPLVEYDAAITNFGESMSSLSTINTADIESIEILKDAASAAIYGSRATNGVVLITTKSGRAGKSKLDVNINMGISEFANRNKFKMADSKLYLEVVNEGIDNFNKQNNYQPGDLGYLLHRTNPFGNLPDVDWLGLVTQTAFTCNIDASLSGGNEKTTFYIGGSYLSQDGVIKTNHLDKISMKANVKHRMNRWLEIGANNNVSYSKNNRIPGSGSGANTIGRTITQRPYDRPYKPDGSYYVGGTDDLIYHNMIQILNEEETYLDNLRYLGSFFSTINFMENLSLKTSVSADVAYTDDYIYYNENHPYGKSIGYITEGNRLYKSYLVENFINYSDKIGGKITYDLMVGHSIQHTDYKKTTVEAQGFPSPSFDATGVASEILSAGSSIVAYAMESYFGRANLSYMDKYVLNLTFRADGSSKFSRPNRYGYFPSASLGWNVSNESFWGLHNTDLKIRASYGKTGNQEGIGNYASQALISGGNNYKNESGIAILAAGNKNLKWETADQYDIGFDLALLNGKINMIADFYLKNTNDLLYNKPVPTTSGFTSITSNIGSMQNKGIEFTINGHFNLGSVKWTSSFNIAHNQNKLTKLLNDEDIITYGSLRAYKVGKEVGSWYLYNAVGIYQYDDEVPETLYKQGVRAGDVKYEGDEDGKIDQDDMRFIGSSNPKIAGGWSNTFSCKGFDLNFLFSYKFGQKVYSVALQQSERIGGDYGLTEAAGLERWTGPGTSNTYPRAYNSFTHNYKYSTRHLQNGSYIRLRAITLSYNLPKNIIEKIGLSKLRAYVQGDNLVLFTHKDYRGYDPEIMNNTNPAYQGYDNYIVPQPRTVTFGLNATF